MHSIVSDFQNIHSHIYFILSNKTHICFMYDKTIALVYNEIKWTILPQVSHSLSCKRLSIQCTLFLTSQIEITSTMRVKLFLC